MDVQLEHLTALGEPVGTLADGLSFSVSDVIKIVDDLGTCCLHLDLDDPDDVYESDDVLVGPEDDGSVTVEYSGSENPLLRVSAPGRRLAVRHGNHSTALDQIEVWVYDQTLRQPGTEDEW